MNSTDLSESILSGVLAGAYLIYVLVALFVGVLMLIAMWRIYAKAGEHGWASIIPIYNVYVLFKITWGSGWYFLLLLIPLANFVISIITNFKLAKVFGHGAGFGFGLLFFPNIFQLILAFGSSQFNKQLQ